MINVVCIAGPTAAGKTELALALARRLPAEIISVDSAMVYRGLDIGTAKPDAAMRAAVPHHLIDIRDPDQVYSAGDFRRDADALIRAIHARGRVPLLVGGTMLYFRALQRGLAPLPGADPAVRAAVEARAAALGWPALHAELAAVDPAAAARIEPADRQRIQRALEVHAVTGRPISELQPAARAPAGLRFAGLALQPASRHWLHARIEQRFDAMLAAGLVAEVAGLRERYGAGTDLPALRAVGYRQLVEHLAGEVDLEEARRRAIVATRRYARRQLTWLRGEAGFEPVDCQANDRVEAAWRVLQRAGVADAISRPSG